MIRIRRLASALCLALLCIKPLASNAQQPGTLDPTQVYTTGNIVQPTTTSSGGTPWVNGVYQDTLNCWSFIDVLFGGYCGPNAIVRPGGSINFSYGTTDLHQAQAIASVLPNSGSGLRVNGFNFGFTAKNGNGWDNGGVDTLSAYTTLYDASGQVAKNYVYDLNYKFNWTTFNYSENFTTPYATKDLSNVRYGFVGKDNNYWLGPYGPEVTNVNFSLKYSVDPCSVNVLSSPTCPGYLEALAKLAPTTTESAPAPASASAIAPPPPPPPPPAANATSVEGTQPPPPPPNPGAASQTAAAPATVTTVTPSATNPQPKVGEVQVSGSKPAPTISTSQALSIINNEQSRVGNVEKSAVATATQQAATAASAAVTEAESVAGTLTTQSIAISMASSQTTTSTITLSRSPSPQIQLNQGVTTFSVSPINSGSIRINELPSFAKQNETTSSISYSIAPPTFNMTDKSQQNEEFVFKQEGIRLQSNPIASHMNPLPVFPSNTNEQSSSSVKRNVQPNEAAGNVDIASMSIIPRGYDAYTSLALKDGSFYKPEEIYKNQKTVDNARVLRGLSGASDMKHQEMVNQQYQKGN